MASENVDDWEQPLPSTPTEASEYEEDGPTYAENLYNQNVKKLQHYVDMMAYMPVDTPNWKPKIEQMSRPNRIAVLENARLYASIAKPKERGERYKRLATKYMAVSPEQVEELIKSNKVKERQKQDTLKRKQELYYEMLTKLESQCRNQYLNVLTRKFGNFIAKLATTMRIPPTLVEPYARMQRGIFCNILLAIGVQPANQQAIFYNTKEGSEYEVCHKLSHALLSLIIKALDGASTRNPDDMQPIEADFEMDNYIKERLMCAAEKKVQQRSKSPPRKDLSIMGKDENEEKMVDFTATFRKCDKWKYRTCK